MQMLEQLKRHYSPGKYLELEDAAEFRSEYVSGQMIPMAGGTVNHNRLAGNLCSALTVSFVDKAFEAFVGGLKVWLPQTRVYAYPDGMVVAGEPICCEDRADVITNPQVIVEILSIETMDYDRGEKFLFYRSLPTFQEYLLVDQRSVRVERYTKTGIRQWSMQEYTSEDESMVFATIPFEMSLVALYNKVRFPPAAPIDLNESKPD